MRRTNDHFIRNNIDLEATIIRIRAAGGRGTGARLSPGTRSIPAHGAGRGGYALAFTRISVPSKPVELLEVIQKNSLITRFYGIDKFDERAFWLAYAKGYVSSDEFSQADIDTIYSGMEGYEPYKAPSGKDETRGNYETFRALYRAQKEQG